jgi:hypothetical protein
LKRETFERLAAAHDKAADDIEKLISQQAICPAI